MYFSVFWKPCYKHQLASMSVFSMNPNALYKFYYSNMCLFAGYLTALWCHTSGTSYLFGVKMETFKPSTYSQSMSTVLRYAYSHKIRNFRL